MTESESTLKALLAHPLCRGVVPDRRWTTYADLAGKSAAERHEQGIHAIEAVPTWREAESLVRDLALQRYERAVPTLIQLWERCPVSPVMVMAGHALLEIGTPEAHQALQEAIDDADEVRTVLAIKSTVLADPASAYDRLQLFFSKPALADPGTLPIAVQILWFFGPSGYSATGRQWSHPSIPELLRADPRWIGLAVRNRHHRELGDSARHLLDSLAPTEIDAALQQWPDPPTPPRPAYTGPRNFLERYERGEHEAVWLELHALGPLQAVGLRDEALTVATATMQRVRTNVELITKRLVAVGYPFDGSLAPWSPPSANVGEDIQRIEAAAGGPVPLSLRAFWMIVGGVYWKHSEDDEAPNPPWGSEVELAEADPLCVDPPGEVYWSVEEWLDSRETAHSEVVGPLCLNLAPDRWHKANTSGGPPYSMILPNDTMDGIFENEDHELPFVEYLRLCLRWGGFPHLETVPLSAQTQAFVAHLTAGLVPF